MNLLFEEAEDDPLDQLIDSRDSMSVICGDLRTVQLPGKTWNSIAYPDNVCDQGRTNEVYQKSQLFIDPTSNLQSVSLAR